MASFTELERDWSIEDVVMMNGVLDALDQAEGRARADTRRAAESAARASQHPRGR